MQPTSPPKRAGVSVWKKYAPPSQEADQTANQIPMNRQIAKACLTQHPSASAKPLRRSGVSTLPSHAPFTLASGCLGGLPLWRRQPRPAAPNLAGRGFSRREVELMLRGDVDDVASQAATLSCLLIVTGNLLGLLGVMLS
jgi:hypothetical protein